jgi:Zn-dependent protease
MVSCKFLVLLNDITILFFVFLFVFTFKGFFQAIITKLMGDSTAQDEGFLTLNPLSHVDILGLFAVLSVYLIVGLIFSETLPREMLFILLVTFGARMIIPIPINDSNFRHYVWGGIVTSLSGAIGNFLLALCAMIITRLLMVMPLPAYALISFLGIIKTLVNIAVIFGLLDLVPLPPFDGGRLLRYVLPYSKQYIVLWLEEYSFFILLILFFAPGISDLFFGTLSVASGYIKSFMFSVIF